MYLLHVNGKEVTASEDKRLLEFLRDDLRLTAVKDGCSEGACGTCTILVDGKATKCCIQKVSKFVGKEIVTVEGLSDREKKYMHFALLRQVLYSVVSVSLAWSSLQKALIDKNPDPTRADVKKAIRGNICRCTGYAKIEVAILMAASI